VAVVDGNTDKCFFKPNKPTSKGEEFIFCVDEKEVSNEAKDANFVAILQDDGVIAYYFHLKKHSIVLKEDQRVESGQLVGKVGSSGISSVPHFHLTLQRIKPFHELQVAKDFNNNEIAPRFKKFPQSADDFKIAAGWRAVAKIINPYSPMLWMDLDGVMPKKTRHSYAAGAAPTCSLGQPCPNNLCQPGLVMKDGVCKKVGILPNKPCDQNQICGPGLECNGETCKLPPPPSCGNCPPFTECKNGKCVPKKP
jgi:hypothetical protein